MAHEEHVAETGYEVLDVEWAARQSWLDGDLDLERGTGQLCRLHRAQLGAGQTGIDRDLETLERNASGLGLLDSALGQGALVVGEPIGGVGVAKQPEHG